MSTPDIVLARICRRQFGVFSHAQARAAGVSDSTIVRRAARGRYHRLLPGVFIDRGVPETWEARAMAAQLAVGGEAVLARATAARVLNLEVPRAMRDNGIHLLDRQRTFVGLDGVVVHRSQTFDHSDVTRVGPFVATTSTRTLFDLAGDLPREDLRSLVAQAVRRRVTDATALRAAGRRLGRVPGKRAVLALADELSPLDQDCRSPLETDFLRLMIRAGLPPTAMNHPVIDSTGRRRVIDAVYLPEQLPIELDSRAWHDSTLDRHDDLWREDAIVLTGWRDFLRFDRDDLDNRAGEVVATVRRALEEARRRLRCR